MTDVFEYTTSRDRRAVMALLLLYLALTLAEVTNGGTYAAAGADLVLAVLAVPGSLLVARRVLAAPSSDTTVLGALAAFFVAGLAIGYEGLATLRVVPRNAAVELFGTAALLVALVLYVVARR